MRNAVVRKNEPPLTLAGFVDALIDETLDAVVGSMRRQAERADDLARLLDLPLEQFIEQEVDRDEVNALLADLLGVIDGTSRVDVDRARYLFGVVLDAATHLAKGGALQPDGHALLAAAAAEQIAMRKRGQIEYLVRHGVPRVVLDSGEIRTRVRLGATPRTGLRRTSRASNVAIDVTTIAAGAQNDGATELVLRFRTVF